MNFDVQQINGTEATQYIRENHYTHTCHGRPFPCYGLFEGAEMIGALMFATPGSEAVRGSVFGPEYRHTVTELHRLHVVDGTPKNTESWFIARALRLLVERKPEIRAVLSFADSTEGHVGTIYQATNFIYTGATTARYFYRDQSGRLRSPRQEGKNITVAEALALGWTKEKRLPKHRYLKVVGDRRERRIFTGRLLLPALPFPSA